MVERDLLHELRTIENRPRLVAASRLEDDSIWAEVLNLGRYDVIAKPVDQGEVFYVLAMAWLAWHEELSLP